jgi:hypothetical protein
MLDLEAWLDNHATRCLWNKTINRMSVECWELRNVKTTLTPLIIVIRHGDDDGWDVYVSPTSSNKISDTIDALNKHFGFRS